MSYLNSFNYELLGPADGPKLVFLHGLLGSGANWRKVTPHFQERFQILLFDQRGHGRSMQPESGYSPRDYALDLARILDELKWNAIYLVGHSMGGRNAMQFAADFPRRTIKLVIEDIGPEANRRSIENIERLLALVPTPFSTRAEAKKFLLEKFPGLIKTNPQAQTLAQYFYSNIVEKPGVGADWRFSKSGILQSVREGRSHDYWDLWERISSPTLLIRGGDSDELSPEIYQEMLRRRPVTRGLEIPNAGHWVHFDQAEAFAAAIREFFG